MKCIVINATDQTIRSREYNGLADLQALVGGYIEAAPTGWDNGDVLFVNEEGKLKGWLNGFVLPGIDDVFVGNGVVVGREIGNAVNTRDPMISPAELADQVQWVQAL